MIYLDNAATGFPKPGRVVQAAAQALQRYGGNPGRSGHSLSLAAGEQVFRVRRILAQEYGAAPERVIFTSGCTMSMNLVLQGCLAKGGGLLTSAWEHNCVLRTASALVGRGGVRWEQVPGTGKELVEQFARRIRPDTALVECTHASNVTGQVFPIAEIGALCAQYGVPFAVDAAQTGGSLPLDLKRDHIDYLCLAGHKGFYGPAGVGVLLLGEQAELPPLLFGGTGSNSADSSMPEFYPDRLEPGTLNTPGILGLGAGVLWRKQLGEAALGRELALCRKLEQGLSRISGVEVYTKGYRPGERMPLMLFNIQGYTSQQAANALSRRGFALRGGLHCAPSAHAQLGTLEEGAVRCSLGAFNTAAEVERLIGAVGEMAKEYRSES